MKSTVVAILRHNTTMPGDASLALREWRALAGADPRIVESADDLSAVCANPYLARRIKLPRAMPFVAAAWEDISLEDVASLVRRSGFAQEVLVLNQDVESALAQLRSKIGEACGISSDFGSAVLVCVSHNYVIESEGAVPDGVKEGRLNYALEATLGPLVGKQETSRMRQVRSARKTTLSLSHDLHIYKAKFFPRMVRALINIYGRDATVFDPFCGSGTALLEAALLGQPSCGIDIDPICALISQAKISPFTAGRDQTIDALCEFRGFLRAGVQSKDFEFPSELAAKIARRDRIDGTDYLPEIRRDANVVATALAMLRNVGKRVVLADVLASDAATKKIRYRFVGVGNGRYTIEIIKQSLLDRLLAKIERSLQLVGVFDELESVLNIQLADSQVQVADARKDKTWPPLNDAVFAVTSPPYLPASSGREHYAASRALAFCILGMAAGEAGYFDDHAREKRLADLTGLPESERLLAYLQSDANESADPQRDPMRFERKAVPTSHYLLDIASFGASLVNAVPKSILAMVVADQHTFYSHRRQEIEYVADCAPLYSEIMSRGGLVLSEEIELQLLKSSASRAKPRSKDNYHEAVLIFSPKRSRAQRAA